MHSFISLHMGKVKHSRQAEIKWSDPQFLHLTEPAQLLDWALLSDFTGDANTLLYHSMGRGKSVS